MASFRFNVARIKGCPEPQKIAEAMDEFGLPENDEYGILDYSVTDKVLFATVVRRTHQAIQCLDAENKEITVAPVEKVVSYPFAVKPHQELLEIYSGATTSIEQIGLFFAGSLAFPTVTEHIEIDIPSAIDKLQANTERFQLKSIRVTDYAHSSYMIGPYQPKFIDTQHGMDFLTEYVEAVASANVTFAGPCGRVNVKLSPTACFSFSCNEDDEPIVKATLRKLFMAAETPGTAPKQSQASMDTLID